MGIIAWEDMEVGQTVQFVRYVDLGSGIHHHWGYEPGHCYIVNFDADGDKGPMIESSSPGMNYGFEFELVTDL